MLKSGKSKVTLTCECGETVSGPDKAGVEAAMERHSKVQNFPLEHKAKKEPAAEAK